MVEIAAIAETFVVIKTAVNKAETNTADLIITHPCDY